MNETAKPELQFDIDEDNRTVDPRALCFDILNASEDVTVIFRDFHPLRNRVRDRGDKNLLPPAVIEIPPGHMCTIPDEVYLGKTSDGRAHNSFYKVYGDKRPTRITRKYFRGRKMMTRIITPTFKAVPLSEKAWAVIEEIKAGKGAL